MSLFTKNIYNIYVSKDDDYKKIINLLILNNLNLKKIMAEQKELAEQIVAVTTQVEKIAVEVSATLEKVSTLEAALEAADDVTPEVQAAFDALKTQVSVVDDLIPDATTTTTTTVEDTTTTTTEFVEEV